MKKVGVIVVALVLLLCIGTVGAFAARGNGAGFIDANGDGICDNYGSRGSGVCFVDADGNVVCDNYGTGCHGVYFIDNNNDGICDNYGSRLGQKNCGGRHCGYNR